MSGVGPYGGGVDVKPIRYDADLWVVMRNDPEHPKAVIQRVHHDDGDRYLVFRWDLDPTKRVLMCTADSLEQANNLVRYEVPPSTRSHVPEAMYGGAIARDLWEKDQAVREARARGSKPRR